MDILELMASRHSVRQYSDREIEPAKKEILERFIGEINAESGMRICIRYNEEQIFNSFLAHYGKFENVKNYVALIGKKGLEESSGYYGEQVVLKAQELGLNTCWVALTYKKSAVKPLLQKGEKLYCVLALGYGKTQGHSRKSKRLEEVSKLFGDKPDYWDKGVQACLLAPTATNQQKFEIVCRDGQVEVKKKGVGFYTQTDLGIVKCHFELATGVKVFYR